MNISGIRTCAGFYDYNIIKQNEIRSQQIQEAKASANSQDEEVEEVKLETAEVTEKDDFGARDFADRFQPEASYELKGSESDITKLDVEKAISDMKKDAVLEQYQFFVGKKTMQTDTENTSDRDNENFML